ncbi:hypothetical protein RPPS3_19290 [Rhodopseudomonas palustris]|nr:hypothetical protein RPPS3_19290 [Rhodopseudomonas palustris]
MDCALRVCPRQGEEVAETPAHPVLRRKVKGKRRLQPESGRSALSRRISTDLELREHKGEVFVSSPIETED